VNILIANLGSTSFKYKLFEMSEGETLLADGAVDRIGLDDSNWEYTIAAEKRHDFGKGQFSNHNDAIKYQLDCLLKEQVVADLSEIGAIGFKAVHGGSISGAVLVDDSVIKVMNDFANVAPAHNPIYVEAMKVFSTLLPEIPQIAAFETAFHQSIPEKRQVYAIPYEWTEEFGVRRYGFHGSSHRYIGSRLKEIDSGLNKIINCHLGGSSSITAIKDNLSVANSFGMTLQTGIPHAVRVGDFDAFSIIKLVADGVDQKNIWDQLCKESGLLGMSGVSSDLRDIEEAAHRGDKRADLAIDVLAESVRDYIGAYLTVLNGVDAICFTGGIGQHSSTLRERVLKNMTFAGIKLDTSKNASADGKQENRIDHSDSQVQIWILPTNEELIVARQVRQVLAESKADN
jgi:acetate kinase